VLPTVLPPTARIDEAVGGRRMLRGPDRHKRPRVGARGRLFGDRRDRPSRRADSPGTLTGSSGPTGPHHRQSCWLAGHPDGVQPVVKLPTTRQSHLRAGGMSRGWRGGGGPAAKEIGLDLAVGPVPHRGPAHSAPIPGVSLGATRKWSVCIWRPLVNAALTGVHGGVEARYDKASHAPLRLHRRSRRVSMIAPTRNSRGRRVRWRRRT
jgi:hypothetical protein